MNLMPPAVRPEGMSLGLQHLGNTPIEFLDELAVNRLEPNPPIVALSID
jgi:hypothetical protein